ncbi:hypothetical protein ARTHRO9AX_150081 [Arthrobacter sp. 9AX]|nr:hypothetical protein ARTHRO9AX_150081 [Arthrobacter sp. 9AX]
MERRRDVRWIRTEPPGHPDFVESFNAALTGLQKRARGTRPFILVGAANTGQSGHLVLLEVGEAVR